MKKSLIITFVILITQGAYCQEIPTIRTVFDFEINDVFHFRREYSPMNANRIKIMDKYYSSNKDTLFYVRFIDSYFSEVIFNGDPPEVHYFFETNTDTIFFTSLDSSVAYYFRNVSFHWYTSFNQTTNANLCDIEGTALRYDDIYNSYIEIFSPKLGSVYMYDFRQGKEIFGGHKLFYFKNSEQECGTPDHTAQSIQNKYRLENFDIYPNPTEDFITIKMHEIFSKSTITITDIKGNIVLTHVFCGDFEKIDIRGLDKGIYYVKIISNERVAVAKFLKI